MSGELHVVAIITPAPGKEERCKQLLTELANGVHQHEKDGCLAYEFWEQFDAEDGQNKFVAIEKYANQAAFEAHGKTEHFQSVVKTATEEGLLAAPLDVKKVKAFAGFNKR